jgi:hypothetical protein
MASANAQHLPHALDIFGGQYYSELALKWVPLSALCDVEEFLVELEGTPQEERGKVPRSLLSQGVVSLYEAWTCERRSTLLRACPEIILE